jgi:uncharacterized protein YdhG (YjbR/CyaY superfamily)
MNMFKPVRAKSTKEYFEMLPEDRRKTMKFLHAFIRKNAPKLRPNFLYNMPGYGSFPYKNHAKKTLDWPVIALASQKNYISVYICALEGREYIAEKYKNDLGHVSVGRSCIRFKKLEDLDFKTFKKVIQLAVKFPGLVRPGE